MRPAGFLLCAGAGALLVSELHALIRLHAEGAVGAPLLAAALLAPVLPLTRIVPRAPLAALAALVAVAALALPAPEPRLVLGVACGGIFLAHVPAAVATRELAAGLGAALLLAQPGLPGALAAAGACAALGALAILVRWLSAASVPLGAAVERRARGLRLRGALALGATLFLVGSVVAAAAPLPGASVALAGAAAAAVILQLRAPGPLLAGRRHLALAAAAGSAAAGAALVTAGALPAHRVATGLAAFALLALLPTLARALTPAPGRRSGAVLSAGWLLLLLLERLAAQGRPAAVVLAALVLVGALTLLPRTTRTWD